jgi:hypothetical protein
MTFPTISHQTNDSLIKLSPADIPPRHFPAGFNSNSQSVHQYNINSQSLEFSMNCLLTPMKLRMRENDDACALRSETSTSCHSDDDHEDIQSVGHHQGYHYENVQSTQQSNATRANNHKLKNELCRNYLSLGYCPYNDKCQFAHGTN